MIKIQRINNNVGVTFNWTFFLFIYFELIIKQQLKVLLLIFLVNKTINIMTKILVFYGNQPCLDTATGLNRDRNPNSCWSQLRSTVITVAKEMELTPELKQILLEDIAYVYGNDSKKFTAKLKEFNLIIT